MPKDETYIIDLCDELLGLKAERQYKFEYLHGDENTTLVVASPEPGWIADSVPSGWAARAAATCSASGRAVSPRAATVN